MPFVTNSSVLKSLLLVLAILISISSSGQSRFTVSGTIKDALSGETLIGANGMSVKKEYLQTGRMEIFKLTNYKPTLNTVYEKK